MDILNKSKKEKKKESKAKPEEKMEEKKNEFPRGGIQPRPASLVKQAWITEKAGDLSGLGKYVFIIDRKANKRETKKAIESIYSVKVENVNIINMKGKSKRLGRSTGKTSGFKKAIVTLKKGQKIDIMPA